MATTRTDGRYSTHTDLVVCENCETVSIAEVRVDEVPGIAAVTCPECGTTQEPSHPRNADGDMVDGAVRTRVIAFVAGTEHVRLGDVEVSTMPEGGVFVGGNAREQDFDLIRGVAQGCEGDFERGRSGEIGEFSAVFRGDSA